MLNDLSDIRQESMKLLAISVPIILSQIAQISALIIDSIMAGHLSTVALATISVASSFFLSVVIFCLGIFTSLNVIVAQYFGGNDHDGIRKTFQAGLLIAVIISIPCVLILQNAGPVLQILHIESSIIPNVKAYLKILSFGIIGYFLFVALRYSSEGLFLNKIVMLFIMLSLPMDVVLNYWFMYGGLGVPKMGLFGIGWATNITWMFTFIGLLLFTMRAKRHAAIKILTRWTTIEKRYMADILKIGTPIGISLTLEVLMFTMIGLFIGRYDVTTIAAYQIAVSMSELTFMLPLGLSIGITARVGYHIGSNNTHMTRLTGCIGLAFAFGIMTITAIVFLSFPQLLAQLFTHDQAIVTIATSLLFLSAIYQIFDGLQVAAHGILQGMKDTKIPMYFCLLSYWFIGFPVGYIGAEVLEMGVEGYWIGMICGLISAATLLIYRSQIKLKSVMLYN